jgi:hypothetical protein
MNDDIDDPVERIEDAIQEAAESIERAINEHSALSVFQGLMVGLFGIFLFVSLLGAVWHSKWRYELQYDVLSTQIQNAKEPHDCDFLAAPLGDKNCHYEVSVSTIRWATSPTGLPIASVDDGKTWNTFVPDAGVTVPSKSTVEHVYISWEKKME